MSFGLMVTRLACSAQRFVSSKTLTRYASAASCEGKSATRGRAHAHGSHLQSEQRHALEADFAFEVLCDLADETLERQLSKSER